MIENIQMTGYAFVDGFSTSAETAAKQKAMDFPEGTKRTLLSITDSFFQNISLEASKITLYSLVNNNNSIIMNMFSQNLDEYIYLMVSQSVTSCFNAELKNVINEFCEVLIKEQEGLILNNPEPFDLKFKLKNGEEYWIDIKSSNEQKKANMQTVHEHKAKAEMEGKKYLLCIYDEEYKSHEDYLLNGDDFWKMIGGFDKAKSRIFDLVRGAANSLSISSIVKETQRRFLAEWRMQE